MSIQQSQEKMLTIQSDILNFLDNEDDSNENFKKLLDIFSNPENESNKYFLVELFHLLAKIANNHHRGPSFFEKIEQIIIHFKDQIQNKFTNTEIFNIFKGNKRILLFLIEEKLMTMNEYIFRQIITEKYVNAKYPQYFAPEIKGFLKDESISVEKADEEDEDESIQWVDEIKKELPDDFYEKRKIGENDNTICELIQKDSVKEFIIYMTRNNRSIDSKIEPSIYETNSFLYKKRKETKNDEDRDDLYFYRYHNKEKKNNADNISLIEYAAFCGSIQIFQYLILNNAKLNDSLWFYSIHGNNAEIIHLLENYKVETKGNTYKQCFLESIKCHHNDLANYFLDIFLQNDEVTSNDTFIQSLKSFNFNFIQDQLINESSFNALCTFDYCMLVDILLKDKKIESIIRKILIIYI